MASPALVLSDPLDTLDPIFGLTRLVPAMRAVQVRSELCASRRRFVLEHCGTDGLAALAAGLDPAAREMLENPPHSRWGSLGTLMDLDRAIVDGPMDGDVRRMRKFGEEIGTYDVTSLYKLVVKLAVSPRNLSRRLVPIFGNYFEGMRATMPDEGWHCAVIAIDRPVPLHLCEYGIPGFIHSALALSSARRPTVTQTACIHSGSPSCTWRLGWDG